jgi:hypothetical protein
MISRGQTPSRYRSKVAPQRRATARYMPPGWGADSSRYSMLRKTARQDAYAISADSAELGLLRRQR